MRLALVTGPDDMGDTEAGNDGSLEDDVLTIWDQLVTPELGTSGTQLDDMDLCNMGLTPFLRDFSLWANELLTLELFIIFTMCSSSSSEKNVSSSCWRLPVLDTVLV